MFGIGLPRWQQHRAATAAQVAQQQRQQELAQDNALLEEVDQDVSQVVPDAMQPLSENHVTGMGTSTGTVGKNANGRNASGATRQ